MDATKEAAINRLVQLQQETNKADREIHTLYLNDIEPLVAAKEFDKARECMWGMPECMAKFDLIRYIRMKEKEATNTDGDNS